MLGEMYDDDDDGEGNDDDLAAKRRSDLTARNQPDYWTGRHSFTVKVFEDCMMMMMMMMMTVIIMIRLAVVVVHRLGQHCASQKLPDCWVVTSRVCGGDDGGIMVNVVLVSAAVSTLMIFNDLIYQHVIAARRRSGLLVQ